MAEIILLSAFLFTSGLDDFNGIHNMKIVPEDTPEVEADYVIGNPVQMVVRDGFVYVLDQHEQAIHQLDMDGNHVRLIGSHGEGPGELIWPHAFSVQGDEVVVIDQTGRVTFYDRSGRFTRVVNIMDRISKFAHTPNGFVAFGNHKTPYTFAQMDREFNRTQSMNVDLSPNGMPYQHSLNAMGIDGKVHFLQFYDTGFWVYDDNGTLVNAGHLKHNPMEEPELVDHGIRWAYRAFTMFEGNYVAHYAGYKRLNFHIYSQKGKLLKRVHIPMEIEGEGDDGLVMPMGMDIVQHKGRWKLYSVQVLPQGQLVIMDIDPSLFKP